MAPNSTRTWSHLSSSPWARSSAHSMPELPKKWGSFLSVPQANSATRERDTGRYISAGQPRVLGVFTAPALPTALSPTLFTTEIIQSR